MDKTTVIQPDFATLKPVGDQPDFATLKPVESTQTEQPRYGNLPDLGKVVNPVINVATSPVLPATGQENLITAPLKTAINLPTSFLGALKGFFIDNPIKVAGEVIDSAKQFYKLTQSAGGIVNAFDYLGQGITKSAKEGYFNPGTVTKRVAENVLPTSTTELAKGIYGIAKGNISPATEQHFTNAKIALINDPFGQIAPYVFLAEGGFKKIGKGDAFQQGMSDIARPVIEGGEKIGSAIKAGAEKVTAPFGRSYQSELATKFEQAGIKPPVSAVTTSPFLKNLESLMSKTPFGQDIYDIYTKARETLDTQAETLIKEIKPQMLTDESLGKEIIQANHVWEENYRQTEGKIWNQFNKENGQLPITNEALNSLTTSLEEIVADEAKDLYGKPNPRLISLLDMLRATQKANTSIPFDVLKKTQESVGYDIARFDDPSLKRLYGPLRDALNATVSAKDPQLGTQLDKMFSDYKTMQQIINDSIGKSIERSSPENIAKNLMSKKGTIFLNSLKTRVGPEVWGEYVKSYLGKILENSMTRGSFDVDKFSKNLGDINSDSAKILFDEAQRNHIADFIDNMRNNKELHDALKSGTKIREGSQTAYTNHTMGMMTAVTGFFSALASGHFAIAATIIAGIAGEYGVSKLFTSETGRKFLTEGFTKDIKSGIKNYIKKPKLGMSIEDISKNNPLTVEARKYKSVEEFAKKTFEVPIESIHPSTIEENMEPGKSYTKGPIQVAFNRGGLEIIDGNHRYRDAFERGDKTVKIRFDEKIGLQKLTDFYNKVMKSK